MLDWQILSVLANLVAVWQDRQKHGQPKNQSEFAASAERLRKRLYRNEDASDADFDFSYLTDHIVDLQNATQTMMVLHYWGLVSHRHTPNFDAIKRLLDVRYMNSTDDIPHNDPFPGI